MMLCQTVQQGTGDPTNQSSSLSHHGWALAQPQLALFSIVIIGTKVTNKMIAHKNSILSSPEEDKNNRTKIEAKFAQVQSNPT